MFPELFEIPGLGVHVWAYGFMLATAFAAGLSLVLRFAAQDGLPARKLYFIGLAVIPSALAGGQLMKLVDSGPGFSRSFSLADGSGSYFGGLLAAAAISAILTRRWGISWRRTADVFAPSIALGYGLTRLGCFLASCCWGKPTGSWIGVTFPVRAHLLTGVPIDHKLVPTQLLEAGLSFSIFVFLLALSKRRTFHGQVILAYVLCYSVARFAIEWWRADPRGTAGALSLSQWVSAILFPIAATFYFTSQSRVSNQRRALPPTLTESRQGVSVRESPVARRHGRPENRSKQF